jgi:Asp-tRNA(Asn)/Glu-tRNA(Gln) amidotransferase C subunit
MANEVTKETIKTLAQANGLSLPDERLERVLHQYQTFMRLIERLDAYQLKMDEEPQTIFTLVPDAAPNRKAASAAQKKGDANAHR